MLSPDLGHPEFKVLGKEQWSSCWAPRPTRWGNLYPIKLPTSLSSKPRFLMLCIRCPWLHFVQSPSLCCLASFILSGIAAAASQPTAAFWDASGNSWNSPKGWFYTTKSGTKYSPLHRKYGKYVKEIPLSIGSSKSDQILLWKLLTLFICRLLNQFVGVSIFCINVSCFSEAQIEVTD